MSRWHLKNAQTPGETWCLLWREKQLVRVIALRHGKEIRFCGHGLVAAGYCWFRHCGEQAVLAMQSGRYATRQCGASRFCIAAAPIALHEFFIGSECDSKHAWFDKGPSVWLSTGADDDYFLCVWPSGVDIATIQPNFELIARQKRAVVMTQCDAATFSASCASAHLSSGVSARHFDLRYLAPQYLASPRVAAEHRESEGRATGSAAAIAANYWRIRLSAEPRHCFIAHQRSAGGGEIYCTVVSTGASDAMWIGGRVSRLSGSAQRAGSLRRVSKRQEAK